MTKTKFPALPKRFDDRYANDGIWFDPYDPEVGIEYPQFKLAYLDTTTDRFLEVAERLNDQAQANAPKKGFRQPAKLSKKEREKESAVMFAKNFIEMAMVDWTVGDGKFPFTKELAVEYFDVDDQDKRWLLRECVQFASKLSNYQPDGQDEAPEGN